MFGLFIIEAGQEPVAVLGAYDHKPLVFETGAEAARVAADIGRGDYPTGDVGYFPLKCQPRRLANDAWKTRELGRFADGTYIPLPWADLPKLSLTAEHFAHVSTVDGARIAYTPDASKGAGDIQTRVKPGRYLAQFYGDIFDAPTIARMAAEFDTQHGEGLVLQFASTEDAIEHVYRTGPDSCMSKALHWYKSPVHPVRVYAAGDLAVAYIKRNGDITARALCWPEKKLYGRIYGDETRLVDLLEGAGFSEGELDGARMLRIPHRDGFVLPYIDGCQCAGDHRTYLILGDSGLNADRTDGLSEASMCCEACGEGIDEYYARSNDYGENYCECCFSERYTYCERSGDTCDIETSREVICTTRHSSRRTTQTWGESAIEDGAFVCEGNGDYYSNEFLVTLADGTQWSQDYFEDHGSVCEGSGDTYAIDDMVQLEDGTMWSKDYFADNGLTVEGKLYDKDDAPEAEEPEDAHIQDQTLSARIYRASPTVKCDAQLEMTLTRTPQVIGPDTSDGFYRISPYILGSGVYGTRETAEQALSRMLPHGAFNDWDYDACQLLTQEG